MGAASCPSAGQLPPSLRSFALTLPLAFLAKGLSHFIRTMSVLSWRIRTCLTALPMSFYCRRPAFWRTTFARPVFGPVRRTASLPLVPSCPSRRTSMVSAELSGGASLSFLRRALSAISMSLRMLLATLAPCWLQVAFRHLGLSLGGSAFSLSTSMVCLGPPLMSPPTSTTMSSSPGYWTSLPNSFRTSLSFSATSKRTLCPMLRLRTLAARGLGSTLWPLWPATTPVPLPFAAISTGPLRSLLPLLTRFSSVSMRSISWNRPALFRSVATSTPLSRLLSLLPLRPLVLLPLRPLPVWITQCAEDLWQQSYSRDLTEASSSEQAWALFSDFALRVLVDFGAKWGRGIRTRGSLPPVRPKRSPEAALPPSHPITLHARLLPLARELFYRLARCRSTVPDAAVTCATIRRQNAKVGSSLLRAKLRSAQYQYWHRNQDMWVASGTLCEWLMTKFIKKPSQ